MVTINAKKFSVSCLSPLKERQLKLSRKRGAFEAMRAGETHSRHVIGAASLQSHVALLFSKEKREYSGSSHRVRRLYYRYYINTILFLINGSL